MSALVVAEPPAAYAERPRLVVDASVLAAGLFAEPGRDDALSCIRGRRLCAPHLVDYEITNVALSKVRQDVLDPPALNDALTLYSTMGIERHAIDSLEVFALAARTRLTAYDAAYLWLAQRLNAPLATFDSRLGAAAIEHLRVSK
jgi:predicted nucleic acid-binding protein